MHAPVAGALASRMILSQAQEALQVTGRAALPNKALGSTHRDGKKALQEGRKAQGSPRIPKPSRGLRSYWPQTPRPTISTIAKEIGYPRVL